MRCKMGNCKFANELNRLCKSSSDSIDNTEKFDDFKKYMHVTRTTRFSMMQLRVVHPQRLQ